MTTSAHPRPKAVTGRARCGWCITGEHERCAIAVQHGSSKDNSRRIWRCGCTCEAATTGTKCVDCNRRGVEVLSGSTCVDLQDCRIYRETRRINGLQALGITPPKYDEDEEVTPKPKTRRTPAPAKAPGACICCGGATKGGKFLPGHDARWVSSLAEQFKQTGDADIEQRVSAVSAALHAKFLKKVAK